MFSALGLPARQKKYIQRLTQWSIDDWKGTLATAVLGTFQVPKTNGVVDGSDSILDRATSFVSWSNVVQPLLLKELFVANRILSLHQFESVKHTTHFDSN